MNAAALGGGLVSIVLWWVGGGVGHPRKAIAAAVSVHSTRIAQAVVVAATRNYGVPDNETDLLHHKTTEIHQAVLTTYPNHDIATVVDWMLLAAINALIAGDQSGANYHLAWAIAAISTRRSR